MWHLLKDGKIVAMAPEERGIFAFMRQRLGIFSRKDAEDRGYVITTE